MKKITTLLLFALLPLLFLASCTIPGAEGDAGAAGPTGLTVATFQKGAFPSDAYDETADNNILLHLPANNYGTSAIATIGNDGATDVYRALLRFDVSSIVPSTVTVVEAYLIVTMSSVLNNTINAYAVTQEWEETQSTWNLRQTGLSWAVPGGDAGSLQGSAYSTTYTATIALSPALVSSWIADPDSNYGVLLKAVNETTTSWSNIFTSEYATASMRPRLVIYYRLP
jgi:hypothetical protein